MGLAERRISKEFQENQYQSFLKEIKETLGKELELEVAWNTLQLEGMSHLYEKAWSQVYFQPLVTALKSICQDEMGKEAISEELEKIVIKNEGENHNADTWASFADKTLVLDHKPTSNIDREGDRAKSLQILLENSL